MKSRSDVKARLRQASWYHLKRILKRLLDEAPENCGHNEEVALGDGTSVRMCSIPEETGAKVCDARVPGCNYAPECDWFCHAVPKELIKERWESFAEGDPDDLLRAGYPDLVALRWVLSEDPWFDEEEPTPDKEEEPDDPEERDRPSFWKRLFKR